MILATEESGSFDGTPSVVVGLWLHGAMDEPAWTRLRRDLQDRVRTLPWPFHGAQEVSPVALRVVLSTHPGTPGGSFASPHLRRLFDAASALPSAADLLRDSRRAAVKEVPLAALHEIDAHLRRHHQDDHRLVRALADLEHQALQAAVSALSDRGARLVLATPRAADDRSPPRPPPARLVRRDDYVLALEALIERVTDASAAHDRIELAAASRHIHLPTLRTSKELVPVLAREIAGSAATRPDVLITAHRTWRYNEDAHPLHVLLDHVARRARHVLRTDGPCADVARRLAEIGALGLPTCPLPVDVRHDDATLPLLASDGASRAQVADARRRSPTRTPRPTRRWDAEQADAWAHHWRSR